MKTSIANRKYCYKYVNYILITQFSILTLCHFNGIFFFFFFIIDSTFELNKYLYKTYIFKFRLMGEATVMKNV